MKAIVTQAKAPDGFARALRTVRVYMGIPQDDLARKAGYSPNTVCNWEMGRSEPKQFDRHNLSQALGVSPALMARLSMPGDPLNELYGHPEPDFDHDPWRETRFTQAEAASEAGISMSLLQKYQKLGIVKPFRKGNRAYYSRAQVQQLMDARSKFWKIRSKNLSEAAKKLHSTKRSATNDR